MKQRRIARNELSRNAFMDFKGYSVKSKKKSTDLGQHFIVPWEMREDQKKTVY